VLPGADGFAFCRWLRALPDGDRTLVLVGTASEHPDDLRKILDADADDYIRKPYRRDLLDVRLTIAEERINQREAKRLLEESLRQERENESFFAGPRGRLWAGILFRSARTVERKESA
jgi:DNA-binding response OmpR family regulator